VNWVNLSRWWRWTTVFATAGGKMQQNSTSFRKAIDFVKWTYIFIIETLLELKF
jgi:hypothetical protein